MPYLDPKLKAESKRRYYRRNPLRKKLTNKLAWIKFKYGEKAKQWFVKHPKCQRCGEDRLACLAIHHVNGKKKEVFETLCGNCHAVHHGGKWTMEDWKKTYS